MTQLEDMVRAELTELIKRPPIFVSLSPIIAYMVIGQVQLALRHPQNHGPTAEKIQEFIEELRGQICQPGSALDINIQMGYDPAHDIAGDYPCSEGFPR